MSEKKRLGAFGFALGIVIYFITIIILNLLPPIPMLVDAYVYLFPFPLDYVMILVLPIICGVICYFTPQKE